MPCAARPEAEAQAKACPGRHLCAVNVVFGSSCYGAEGCPGSQGGGGGAAGCLEDGCFVEHVALGNAMLSQKITAKNICIQEPELDMPSGKGL